MGPVQFFDSIAAATPAERIYRRLGYRRGITNLPAGDRNALEDAIERAESLIRLKGAGRRFSIERSNSQEIVLLSGTVFRSEALARYMENCRELVLIGATAGRGIIAAIEEETNRGNLSRAVIFDAAASEIVDAALDWLSGFYRGLLRRENKRLLKRRFSAGYGDFALENQKTVFELLALDRLGVRVTEQAILIPEKSVTAVVGIREYGEGPLEPLTS